MRPRPPGSDHREVASRPCLYDAAVATSGGTKYRMREKLFAIGDDYWIENDDGRARVQGQRQGAADPRHAGARGPSGGELLKIQEKKLHIRDTMEIERGGRHGRDGQEGADHAAAGALLGRGRGRRGPRGEGQHRRPRVQDRARRRQGGRGLEAWFRVRDTYGIEVEPGQDAALILAVTVCIDQMTHD